MPARQVCYSFWIFRFLSLFRVRGLDRRRMRTLKTRITCSSCSFHYRSSVGISTGIFRYICIPDIRRPLLNWILKRRELAASNACFGQLWPMMTKIRIYVWLHFLASSRTTTALHFHSSDPQIMSVTVSSLSLGACHLSTRY